MALFGGVEAGGTKFVCAVGTGPDDLHAVEQFPTTNPEETLGRAVDYFKRQAEPVEAVGIASFGPIDLNRQSPTFGYITTTPKDGWQYADVVGPLCQTLSVPVGFDTDVNGAGLGEYRWGAAQGLKTFVYLTIGTGIGGGGMVEGNLIHGMLHPEMGHMPLPRDEAEDPFTGNCPFHGDCFEGLASGPAIEARWGQRAETLGKDHPAWQMEAHYLALGLVNIITILSPSRIILGGGVMHQEQLFPLVRQEVQRILNKYIQAPEILEHMDTYIVPPGLGARAGVLGAIALAQQVIA